jgi:hypothetical protein
VAPGSSDPPAQAPRRLVRWLAVLIGVAAWSILPPYVGPSLGLELDVTKKIEAIDHLIPGLLAVIGASTALVLSRAGRFDSLPAFSGLAVCALAGLFQTVSHISLVLHAGDPLQPVGSVALHASPGPVLLVLALWLLLAPPLSETGP